MLDYYAEIDKLGKQGFQAELMVEKFASLKRIDDTGESFSLNRNTLGHGLRVIKGGKQGFASSNTFDQALIDGAKNACSAAKRDKSNVIPASDGVHKNARNFFKFKVEDATEKSADFMSQLTAPLGAATITSATVSIFNTDIKIINTEGVDVRELSSAFTYELNANYRKGNKVTPEISEYRASQSLLSNADEIRACVKDKIEAVKIQRKPPKVDTVVFTPKGAASAMVYFLESSFSGRELYFGTSPLSEGMNLDCKLSLTDDPTVKNSIPSVNFDDEGLPRKKIVLMEEGIIKNFLYNTYWSLKASKENNHSAWRADHRSTPGISPTTIVISTKEEKSVTDGALVVDEVMGSESGDSTTGEFSLTPQVMWYDSGHGKVGAKDVMIRGNFKNLLAGIESMSYKNKSAYYGGVMTGDLRVNGLSVS
ncbi:Putative modulator of DNA gyrase [uncultured archaeon]|nr:Putative modulator of DNA gyrase [uncultured archaeon]